MIERAGDRLLISGPVTVDTVPQLLQTSEAHARDGATIVDFAGAAEVDSAALAFIMALTRSASAVGKSIRLAHVPPAIDKLARVYAVTALLPQRAE